MVQTQLKAGQISVWVESDIKKAKILLGVGWRSLIIRGINSMKGSSAEEEEELKIKMAKLIEKVRSQGVKIYNLENKE